MSTIPDLIGVLNETFNQQSSSCSTPQPFITLGSGTPPSINYNIPQKTGFSVTGLIPIENEISNFASQYQEEPVTNLWQQFQTILDDPGGDPFPLIKILMNQTHGGRALLQKESRFGFFKNPVPTTGLVASRVALPVDDPMGDSGTVGGGVYTPTPNNDDKQDINQVNYQSQLAGYYLSQNLFPIPIKKFWGVTVLEYVPKPEPKPQIFLAVSYRVQSYLGNYGAGKVVKTMSLLPGEKTSISIKTYKDFTQTDSHSDNVLDSFTESSADTLENMFEKENSTTNVTSVGLKVGLQIGPVGVGGGINRSTTSISKTINKNLSKHVEESQAQRKVEVNSETTSTLKEGEENSIVRELKNINLSRVLNFTFRQMNQEYIVATYIDDVSLLFTNGFPEVEETARLYEMDSFLEKYITESGKRDEIRNNIIMSIYNLRDHNGDRQDMFMEQTLNSEVPSSLSGIISSEEQKFWSKDPSFTQTVLGTSFSVPGIITQIERHILSTDSVLTEALLGQAEALDCYNIQLQNEAVRKTKLEGLELQQRIEKIEGIDLGNVDLLKVVYGKCCEGNDEG